MSGITEYILVAACLLFTVACSGPSLKQQLAAVQSQLETKNTEIQAAQASLNTRSAELQAAQAKLKRVKAKMDVLDTIATPLLNGQFQRFTDSEGKAWVKDIYNKLQVSGDQALTAAFQSIWTSGYDNEGIIRAIYAFIGALIDNIAADTQ